MPIHGIRNTVTKPIPCLLLWSWLFKTPVTERYRKLQEDYQEAASTVQEQKLLITQLEEDLRSFNAVSSMFRGEAEGEPVTGSQVEADVVAEVVKDVIPSCKSLEIMNFEATVIIIMLYWLQIFNSISTQFFLGTNLLKHMQVLLAR